MGKIYGHRPRTLSGGTIPEMSGIVLLTGRMNKINEIDGNLHPTILTDRRDKEEFRRVEEAIEAIFDVLGRWAGRFQHLFIKGESNTQGTSCARLSSPLLGDRHFMPLARTPFHMEAPRNPKSPSQGIKAVFFTGCPACMMQISDVLAKHKKKIKVCHPMELYAESLEEKN